MGKALTPSVPVTVDIHPYLSRSRQHPELSVLVKKIKIKKWFLNWVWIFKSWALKHYKAPRK